LVRTVSTGCGAVDAPELLIDEHAEIAIASRTPETMRRGEAPIPRTVV
jgi:hypothetical protein